MYLHELRRIIRKTGKDQIAQRKEANPERAQLFSPAEPVVSEYGFDVVFINGWIAFTDHADATAFFVVIADPLLVGKRDLGVGNHGGEKKCMSSTAFGASHPADTEPESSGRQLYGPPVVTMNRQTGRMRTGTGQLVKLKVKNNRIIKGLRNLIAIPDKNGYHGIVNRHRVTCVCEQ